MMVATCTADGTRVSRHLAVYLAPSYHMADLIDVRIYPINQG